MQLELFGEEFMATDSQQLKFGVKVAGLQLPESENENADENSREAK